MNKIALFGTGYIFQVWSKYFDKEQIVGVFDNDKEKWGTKALEFVVSNPDQIKNIKFDYIYILVTVDIDRIYLQLIDYGINREKIKFYIDIPIERSVKVLPKKDCLKNNSRLVTILVHSLEISGASMCALKLANCLINQGYDVDIGCPAEGMLINDFLGIGAKIFIDMGLLSCDLSSVEWIKKSDLVIVNTYDFYYLLRKINDNQKVVWWLHEPPFMYKNDLMNYVIYNGLIDKTVTIWAVSSLAKMAYMKYDENAKIEIQPFGLADESNEVVPRESERWGRFISVGNMTPVKGYDVLLNAFDKLCHNTDKNTQLIIVGNTNTEYGKEILNNEIVKAGSVAIKGTVSHKDTLKLINESDILVCSSYEESMSIVVNEAFMLGKAVICSDRAGICEFVTPDKDCLLFMSGDNEDLYEKMLWALNNKTQMINMGKNAREIFETYFSYDQFTNAIINRIEEIFRE